jgi:hypothetical protein
MSAVLVVMATSGADNSCPTPLRNADARAQPSIGATFPSVEGERAFRLGALPAVLAIVMIWALVLHNVATLDYPHAMWRCGSTLSVLTNSDYVPSLTDIDQGIDRTGVVDRQAHAATAECQSDANNELTWQIPVDVVVVAWLVVWRRRWSRAKLRDDARTQVDAARRNPRTGRAQSTTTGNFYFLISGSRLLILGTVNSADEAA